MADTVNNLTEVVRRDIGRHTDRDAVRAVDEQAGEAGGQHDRLLTLLVEVRHEVDRIFLDIGQHGV